MLFINYNKKNKKFEIFFNTGDYDWSCFEPIIEHFKRWYIYYDSENRVWSIPESRIDEILLWFNKYEFNYKFMSSAFHKISEIEKSFKQELEIVENRTFISEIINEDSELKLFKFQEEGIDWGVKRNRFYLADDPGLGKTIQAIIIFSSLYYQNIVDKIFIIVKGSLLYHWRWEILYYVKVFVGDDIVLIDNENKEMPFEKNVDKKIMIVADHIFAKMLHSYTGKSVKNLSRVHWNKFFVNIRQAWKAEKICLVVDEAHKFKNPKAVKTKALFAHKEFFDFRIPISATPAINYFEDWWVPITLIDESLLKMSYNAFKLFIADEIGDQWNAYNIQSYNIDNIKKIKDVLSKIVLKRLKSELPEVKTKRIIKPIYFKPSELYEDLYFSFIQNEILKFEKEYDSIFLRIIFNKFPYLLQIIDNPLLLRGKVVNDHFNNLLEKWNLDIDPRVQYIDSVLKDLVNGEKIIIFDSHPMTLDLLHTRYKKYNPILVHGRLKDTNQERAEKIDLFNDCNSPHKILLISSLIGGEGWNLNKATQRIIVFALPYDGRLFRQLIDRCWRINNTGDALVEIPLLDGTIDILRYKTNTGRVIINDSLLNKKISREELKNLFLGKFDEIKNM